MVFGQAFDPFGNVIGSQGYDSTHYGFTGKWQDASGLLYLRARYYAPGQGSFVSRDPFAGMLSQPSTLNSYAYALNNPVTLTDPSGELPPMAIIAIAGFAAGAVYDAYQQTDGFTDFCQYDILQTLGAGIGGAAAASMATIMLVSGVGMVGMGLQGVALGLYSLGFSTGVTTSLFIAGTTTVSWAGLAMAWLVAGNSRSNPSSGIQSQPTPSSPNGRNPYGKLGGPEHRKQVLNVEKYIKSQGYKPETEYKIYTSGGRKNYRFIDIVALDEDNNPVAFFQIGRVTKGLLPVSRERQAINDIVEYSEYDTPIIFVPYFGDN